MSPVGADAQPTLSVICRAGPERLAFRIGDVHKVMGQARLCRLPRLPRVVAGITQHRGRIVTIFDLGTLLFAAAPREPTGLDARVLVLDRHQRHLAVAVDAVDAIEPLPLGEELPAGPVPALRVAQHCGHAVFAVDVDLLLELAVRATTAAGDFPPAAGSV